MIRERNMASFSKQATLFLVAALLCLLCTMPGQAARPEPRSTHHKLQGAESAIAGTGVEMGQEGQKARTECEVGEGAEDCLMRRTLVAHTDYIYTQGKHN